MGTRNEQHKSIFGNKKHESRRAGETADWSTADPTAIVTLITTATARGGAIRFGYTRDGGAYALGMYYGSESNTEYCRPAEDVNDFLREWTDFYSELPISNGASPDKKR